MGVEIITAHGLDEFDGSSARLSCVYTERGRQVAADAVVLVTARTPLDELYKEIALRLESGVLESVTAPTLSKIGDCDAPAIIAAAIYAGHRYARELEADLAQDHVVRQDRLFDPD
jgi:dimethylamine/trimethylamine dehydrogenase